MSFLPDKIKNLVPDTIRSKISLLNFNNELQSRGLVPVFRVVTQSSYTDTQLGTRLLIDTVPLSLRGKIDHTHVRYDYATISTDITGTDTMAIASSGHVLTAPGLVTTAIASDMKGTIIDGIKSVVKGVDSVDDRSLVECEIKTAIDQPYPTFHGKFNIRSSFKQGDTTDGTDLIKIGFPIWVYMGYMDKSGNVVHHPFDTLKYYNNIPLVFGGIVAGVTHSKTPNGSRILIQAAGYNWYLSRFTCEIDKEMYKNDCKIHKVLERLFRGFNTFGGNDISLVMKKVLRLDSPTLLPQVRYIYGAHKDMEPVESNWSEDGRLIYIRENWTFLQGIMNLERIYDVDIEWGQSGYITIHGRNDPLTRIIKQGKESDERTHNVVVGGNTISIEHSNDSTGIVNDIEMIIHTHPSLPPTSFDINKDFIRAVLINEYIELFGIKDKTGAKEIFKTDVYNVFPGRTIPISITAIASVDTGENDEYDFLKDYDIVDVVPPPISVKLLSMIIKRTHFWGMRGSATVIGNPFIREGDLVQVIDISADRSESFIDLGATKSVLESLADRLDTLRTSDEEKLEYIRDRVHAPQGLPSFTNLYYIWKATHHLGANGFFTKLHFAKQRDAPLSSNNVMNMTRSDDNRGKDKRMGS